MDNKTAEALEGSIKHWEENLAAETPDQAELGVNHCALCRVFYRNNCNGCPVRNKTGDSYCNYSPYEYAHNKHNDWENTYLKNEDKLYLCTKKEVLKKRTQWRIAAREELKFLKSLREEINV